MVKLKGWGKMEVKEEGRGRREKGEVERRGVGGKGRTHLIQHRLMAYPGVPCPSSHVCEACSM